MSNCIPGRPHRWRTTCPGWVSLTFLLLSAPPLRAHDALGACVHHGVQLVVGSQHLDLTLDLTFFEEWSARERQKMDADNDGAIRRAEIDGYVKALAPTLARQVSLRVAGQSLEPVLLYDPEIDLLNQTKVGPAHHRLRVCFFAPTPAGLRAGDQILFENRLWPEAKALASSQAEGRDGCAISVSPPEKSRTQLRGAGSVQFQCLKPPAAKTAAQGVVPPAGPSAGLPVENRRPPEGSGEVCVTSPLKTSDL